jgi:transposase
LLGNFGDKKDGFRKGIRFTDKFERDAVARVFQPDSAVSELVKRLAMNTKSQFAETPHVRSEVADHAAGIRRFKRGLARVTEKDTILKDRSGLRPACAQ